MTGHETKGKIEEGAAPWEGEGTHGWAPDVGKEGSAEGHEASQKAFGAAGESSSDESTQEAPSSPGE
ncbi:MAG: hypothetical protein NVSMB32_11530 [Actinomycetota bacterium]